MFFTRTRNQLKPRLCVPKTRFQGSSVLAFVGERSSFVFPSILARFDSDGHVSIRSKNSSWKRARSLLELSSRRYNYRYCYTRKDDEGWPTAYTPHTLTTFIQPRRPSITTTAMGQSLAHYLCYNPIYPFLDFCADFQSGWQPTRFRSNVESLLLYGCSTWRGPLLLRESCKQTFIGACAT